MKKLLVATLCGLTSIAHAHPGHDHSHWMSQPIHWLTAISIIAIVAAATYHVKQHTRKISLKNSEGK